MAEKSDNRKNKSCLLVTIVITLVVFLFWLRFLHKGETKLDERIDVLNQTLLEIKIHLGKTQNNNPKDESIIEDTENVIPPKLSYVDVPSPFPRMTNSGVFPMEDSKLMTYESSGRGDFDMNNVAVLVESTNSNDTKRLINSITAQRKSETDLKIFLYSPVDRSGISYKLLKTWAAPESSIFAIPVTNRRKAKLNVLQAHKMKYVITLEDYKHIGDDFADYYFVGKSVMEVDKHINAVCGTSNGGWQDKNLGDVLLLSETPCESGEMVSLRTIAVPESKRIWVRPESARVGTTEKSVTQESPWNIDRFNPLLLRKAEFSARFNHDMSYVEKRPLEEWVTEKTSGCVNDFLMLPYESDEDLKVYFTNTNTTALHKYQGIVNLSIGSCRMFIVPKQIFEKEGGYENYWSFE